MLSLPVSPGHPWVKWLDSPVLVQPVLQADLWLDHLPYMSVVDPTYCLLQCSSWIMYINHLSLNCLFLGWWTRCPLIACFVLKCVEKTKLTLSFMWLHSSHFRPPLKFWHWYDPLGNLGPMWVFTGVNFCTSPFWIQPPDFSFQIGLLLKGPLIIYGSFC